MQSNIDKIPLKTSELLNDSGYVTNAVTDAISDTAAMNGAHNLLPIEAITQSYYGLTFTVNSDNSITISGVATASVTFSLTNRENSLTVYSTPIIKRGTTTFCR